MILYEAELTSSQWIEVLGGQPYVAIDGGAAKSFLLTFTESDDQPALDAPSVQIETYPHGFDFTASGFPIGQRIWARAVTGSYNIQVLR